MSCNFLRNTVFMLISVLLALSSSAQRLPTGQRLSPTGGQIALSGTLPLGVAAVPGTSRVVISCSGALQGLSVVDMHAKQQLSFLPFQAEQSMQRRAAWIRSASFASVPPEL